MFIAGTLRAHSVLWRATHGAHDHAHPGGWHRTRGRRRDTTRPRGLRREDRMGGAGGRRRHRREARHHPSGRGPRLDPQEQGRAQGADRHAHRQGLPLGERHAAAGARPLRQRAAHPQPARHRAALRGHGHRHRPREHRGPLRRPRAHDHAGRRAVHQAHHREGLHAHLRVRLRLRPEDGPQARVRRPQGEHHEALGRPAPRVASARSRSGIRASSRTRSSSTRAR